VSFLFEGRVQKRWGEWREDRFAIAGKRGDIGGEGGLGTVLSGRQRAIIGGPGACGCGHNLVDGNRGMEGGFLRGWRRGGPGVRADLGGLLGQR